MRVPEALEGLLDMGVIDEVIRPLQSGKEAQVFLVVARGWPCVAKVYKEAEHRSFKNRADYIEGRKTRDTRSMRAMSKKSRFGRQQIEDAWRSMEVETIYRLAEAGVAVPQPVEFVDGVLVMERIMDADGNPAPRLCDVELSYEDAEEIFLFLLQEVVKMLCAGIVHGDLSDFNILLGEHGPVLIDFPQAIDAAASQGARKLLIRDVRNLTRFFSRWAPDLKDRPYGEEIWALYERAELKPDTRLTGRWKGSERKADVSSLLREIEEVEREARRKREALGLPVRAARTPVERPPQRPKGPPPGPPKKGAPRGGPPKGPPGGGSRPAPASPDDLDALLTVEPGPPSARKRRRGRGRGRGGSGNAGAPPG